MKTIFLDRDGVINKDLGWYTTSWEEFEFLPGVLKALKVLNEADYFVSVVSNQAGVAKGLYAKDELNRITQNMLKKVEVEGGKISKVTYCLHQDSDNCQCRKPKAGLLLKASEGLNVNYKDTFFVGDSERDILAGKAVGCKTIFVLSGKAKLEDLDAKPDFIANNLLDAVKKIVLKEKGDTT